MSDMTICDGIDDCIAKLQKPDKVEKYLTKLSTMGISQDVLKVTEADKVLERFYEHPRHGKLARKIVSAWRRNAIPSMDPSDDENKRCTLSPQWSTLLAQLQFAPLPTLKRAAKYTKLPTAVPAKRARFSNDQENSTQFTSKRERTRMYTGKSSSPSLASSSSSSSSPMPTLCPFLPKELKRSCEEERLKNVAALIAKRKAETQAANRKTVVLNQSAGPNSSVPFAERVIGSNGRSYIKFNRRN